MSRLGAAGAVAQLVADVPLSSALEVEKIWKTLLSSLSFS